MSKAVRARERAHYDAEGANLERAEATIRDQRRWKRERRTAPEKWGKKGGRTFPGNAIVNPEFVKSGRIEKSFPSKRHLILRSTGSKGFSNDDFWRCYWNSMLQVLMHAPPVYHLLGNLHRDCEDSVSDCVVCALQQLAQEYWNGDDKRLTDDIHRAITRTLPVDDVNLGDYHEEEQNDSAVYLNYILGQLELVSVSTERASVKRVFYFHSQQHMDCVECGERRVWTMNTSRLGFAFNLRHPDEAEGENSPNTVEEYIRDRDLQDRERFTCESASCQLLQQDPNYLRPMQTRHTTLHYCPDVLIITIGRFANTDGEKIITDSDFPEKIDLGPHTSTPAVPVWYRFSGLVAHQGPDVESGHYISVVRNSDQSFRIINDDQVERTEDFDQDVKLPGSDDDDRYQPYVLCYTKC